MPFKTWKSLIGSSDFSGQVQHLLVSYGNSDHKYVSILDDDSFPQHKVSLTIHPWVNMLKDSIIIGSSHGLLCLTGNLQVIRDGYNFLLDMAIIWNPCIRKAVAVVMPEGPSYIRQATFITTLGFGVCRETTDPKIVKITHIQSWSDTESITPIPWRVEVFSLSTMAWRSSYSNLPRNSIRFGVSNVAIDGFLYWLATEGISVDGEFRAYNLIISFDMTSEEFREVNLRDGLAHPTDYFLSMFPLGNSLAVIEHGFEAGDQVFGVWMMEDGVTKSFKKLYSLSTPHASILNGFRKNGALVFEIEQHHGSSLFVFEPYSKHINNLGIIGCTCSFLVYPYMETLLLLDHPDFIIYDKGTRCVLKRIAKLVEDF